MKTFWAIYSAVLLSFAFSVPISLADYWTNEPPIQIGEIELSPGATICVGTEVTLALTDVVDFDTLHYCIEDNKEKTRLEADTSLTTYWTVMKDGEVYDEIEDKALAPSEPLKFTPKQPGKYAIEVYADDHPQEPKRNDDRTSTITATITVLKVDLDGQELQPPPPPQNWKDVPDNQEVNPGVLLVSAQTRLLVQDPGANVGKYKLTWTDPAQNKHLKLVGPGGPNSPIEVDCAGPWPKEYMAVAAGNWVYCDKVDVTLIHSLVPCQDVVKLVTLKVDIEVNNSTDEDDDIVCRYSTDPAGRPTIPCRAKVEGLGSGNITVVLKNKAGDGDFRFPDVADTTKTLTLPASGAWVPFNISGQVKSATMNDAIIEAHLNAADGPLCAEEDVTVLWVEPLTIRTEQDEAFSDDNDCETKPIPCKLGSQKVTGPDEIEPAIAYVVELVGRVKPDNFDQDIILARDKLTRFRGIESPTGEFASHVDNFERDEPDGNDTSDARAQDQGPRPNGNVYDWDMPGILLSTGDGALPDHTKAYTRFNFVQYAVFERVRCSNDFPWWARVTGEIVNNTWSVYSRPGHADDNAAGAGATTMTKD